MSTVVLAAFVQLVAAVAQGVVSAGDAFAAAAATGTPATVLLLVGALGVAAIAFVALRALVAAEPDPAASVHRGQTVDVSRLLSQSDPDAPGRTRPRAPTAA
ncbi:DUF6412 domain-containing protein [Agromyces larvae]|uniref:DUF6412 domain-containing protein n=1 Tax=Agromyces larvae TaxID=2929802 RepID=A0ABY4BWN5_9MICO|nr:DUF6412 domain-containing protein [Agromyces larvae]UOE43641.1 DUF6412 domain-containing protein [Agromyces larvae]